MRKRKYNDTFKNVDFSALGQAIVSEAKRLCHQRHLDGEFDPDWQSCLQQAQKIVVPKFMSVKEKGGINTKNNRPKWTSASPRSRSKTRARARMAGGRRPRT